MAVFRYTSDGLMASAAFPCAVNGSVRKAPTNDHGASHMHQDDRQLRNAPETLPSRERWTAPELKTFDVGDLTMADSNPGDDGAGIFTHS
jgi:hypothetical protein